MSGLVEALKVVGGIEGIATIHFDERDVVRHALVQQIVKAYERTPRRPKPRMTRDAAATRVDGRRRHVTDARGRPRAARAGSAPWLARAAPARARAARRRSRSSATRRCAGSTATFRGVDQATDVLSFPAIEAAHGPARRSACGAQAWPILAISRLPRASRGVRRANTGTPSATELRILALHGLLHLLGYDHEADRGEMRTAGRAPAPAGRSAGRADRRADRPRSASRR